MSNGTPELKRDDRGVWKIHWTDGRRSKRVSTRTKDLAAAKAFLAQWLILETTPIGMASSLPVRDLWAAYRERHVEREVASVMTADYCWKNLQGHFGDLLPVQIDDRVVRDYEAKRARGLIGKPSASPTIRRELVTLRACLNWCASPKRKLLPPAELPPFDLPAENEPADRWLTTDEIKRLFAAAQEMRTGEKLSKGELFLHLALETAARKTAICELTWDRVDWETRVIVYDVPGRRKTKKRRASPPISSTLLPILRRAYDEREGGLVVGDCDAAKVVTRIARRAGLEGVTPHVLRHTAATHMARRGVPLFHIAGILGNSIRIVELVYAKHAPAALREAVETISGGVFS